MIGTIFFVSGVVTLLQTFVGDRLPIIQVRVGYACSVAKALGRRACAMPRALTEDECVSPGAYLPDAAVPRLCETGMNSDELGFEWKPCAADRAGEWRGAACPGGMLDSALRAYRSMTWDSWPDMWRMSAEHSSCRARRCPCTWQA